MGMLHIMNGLEIGGERGAGQVDEVIPALNVSGRHCRNTAAMDSNEEIGRRSPLTEKQVRGDYPTRS